MTELALSKALAIAQRRGYERTVTQRHAGPRNQSETAEEQRAFMAVNENLTRFIRDALNRGLSRDQIRNALTQADWSEESVQAALLSFAEVDFPIAVPRPRPSLSAREAFEYLVLFGTLYISAYSLGNLLFQFTNLAFSDPLWSQDQIDAIPEAIRWSIAYLVVATPVFLYAARTNSRAIALSPTRRTSPVRRWLTYLTLVIAAGVLIGDSTSLVYNLLGGEITIRFLLKALTMAIIAGAAFIYYIADLRRDEQEISG